MRRMTIAALAAAAVAAAAAPGLADHYGFDIEEVQAEIDEMAAEEGIEAIPAVEVAAMLERLGYTDIEEFDVEDDEYEVEATRADGEEVELEIDPETGEILSEEED